MPATLDAVRQGLGIGVVLDPFAREVDPSLVPVSEPLLDVGVWLAMRPEMRDVARVRAVAEVLAAPAVFAPSLL